MGFPQTGNKIVVQFVHSSTNASKEIEAATILVEDNNLSKNQTEPNLLLEQLVKKSDRTKPLAGTIYIIS